MAVLEDENPQVDKAIEWEDNVFSSPMIRVGDEEPYWACPWCITDSFLKDTLIEDSEYVRSDKYLRKCLQLDNDCESVSITLQHGLEVEPIPVLYYHIEEILEDSDVILSMVNGIRLYYENPIELLKRLKTFKSNGKD